MPGVRVSPTVRGLTPAFEGLASPIGVLSVRGWSKLKVFRELCLTLVLGIAAVACGRSSQAIETGGTAGEAVPSAQPSCPNPTYPKDAPQPKGGTLVSPESVPAVGAPTDADQATFATALRGQSELEATIAEGDGRLVIVSDWRDDASGQLLGKVGTYAFARPVQLPTSYGIFHQIDPDAAGKQEVEPAVVKRPNGLPELFPIEDPQRFADSTGMSVFASKLDDASKIEYILDDNSQSSPCADGSQPK